jgi:hypothetical protein
VHPASSITDADGRARTTWTLGADPGRQTLFASVENVDSALPIVAEADPVAANTRVVALVDKLTGKAGEQLPDSMAIRVTDSTGRMLPDVAVRRTLIDGGKLDSASSRTDSPGVRCPWIPGSKRARSGCGAGWCRVGLASSGHHERHRMAGAAVSVVVTWGTTRRQPPVCSC